jgi:hypothetical protein
MEQVFADTIKVIIDWIFTMMEDYANLIAALEIVAQLVWMLNTRGAPLNEVRGDAYED